MYSDLQNLEIPGLPVQPNEDLRIRAEELADKLNKNFDTSSVLAIQRLPAKSDQVPIVVIRFAFMAQNNEWVAHPGELGARLALAMKKRRQILQRLAHGCCRIANGHCFQPYVT